jgi:hypothetical protein
MRLLDRQVNLLEYLTSSNAIFGSEGGTSLDQSLQGIDRGLLRLEARFSHEKRMEKISAVFFRTFQLLGPDHAAIVREFTAACPPIDISRLENARQFYDFLCARWRHQPLKPPHLRDVAACEFACARARAGANAQEPELPQGGHPRRGDFRRHPGVVLQRCAYDIQPIFEGASADAAPIKRDTPLAIAIPRDAEHPKVFELLPVVFDVLATLDDWTDRAALGATPELDDLIGDLAKYELVEVRR